MNMERRLSRRTQLIVNAWSQRRAGNCREGGDERATVGKAETEAGEEAVAEAARRRARRLP